MATQTQLDDLLASVPSQVRGAGGAVAVVQDTEKLVSQRVWGYANLERGIPMTPQTQMPICSISKHMLCLVIADLERRPTETMLQRKDRGDIWISLADELKAVLPQLFTGGKQALKVEDLFNMQSGIRDYWAMTVLWGARAEDPFSLLHDAPRTLKRTKSFHFSPGTEFSYSNVNFHVLGRMVENVAGHSLGQLLAERVFIPAGMKTAALTPNSMGLPLPIVGYEGSEKDGYFPAVNGIEWQGDAGITASLEDMIAYEKYLHRSWDDEGSNYRAIATPATFRDGKAAAYSHGLWHSKTGGHTVLSHTGGLRGFRLQRCHLPEKGLSAVVLLNHETDPTATAGLMIKPLLGVPLEEEKVTDDKPAEEWEGEFFSEEQQRVVTVTLPAEKADERKVLVNYAGGAKPEKLKLLNATTAETPLMKARIDSDKDTLHLTRSGDGVDISCRRIHKPSPSDQHSTSDYAGTYHSAESDSTLTISPASPVGGAVGETLMYASFSGFLGKGLMHLMRYVGEEIWILTCPRTMDAPAPGEWTIVFQRDGDGGNVKGVRVGCWLARGVEYERR